MWISLYTGYIFSYICLYVYFIYTSGCIIFMYLSPNMLCLGFPGGSVVKNLLPMQETGVPSLGHEDPLEEEMATHSSIHA